MFAATSLRKAVLKAAASANVSGGTSRVLVFPGSEAFAITAMPQEGGFWVRMRVCPSPIAADLRERMTLPRRSVPRYAARTHQVTTTLTLRDHIPAGACATRVHATVIVKGDRRPPRRHRPPRNTLPRHRPRKRAMTGLRDGTVETWHLTQSAVFAGLPAFAGNDGGGERMSLSRREARAVVRLGKVDRRALRVDAGRVHALDRIIVDHVVARLDGRGDARDRIELAHVV